MATPHSQLVKVLEIQDAMGWQSFFEGAPALGWSGYMDLVVGYLLSSKSCGILLGICGNIEME
jgi:hypothetical protein